MTTTNTQVRPRTDLYQMVTDRIIKQLEIASVGGGQVPWKKPWAKINGGAFNRITGRPYGLFNQLCLMHDGPYATFEQWKSLGGHIAKGAKGETIVFFKKIEPEETESENDEAKNTEEPAASKPRYVLRYYVVFHESQVLGVDPLPIIKEEQNHNRILDAENLAKGYINREGITLEEAMSNEAYYSPDNDTIHIPALAQYEDISEYYSTLFHEMVHSTGTANRLNRAGLTKVAFGSETYSREELTAEIGAACLLNGLGIESVGSFSNSVAYIENWIARFREDKYLIFNAASAAEKAAKFILNTEAASAS